jgi:hypothetical protein
MQDTDAGATALACGSSLCRVAVGGEGLVKACCFDEATNTCGFKSSYSRNQCILASARDRQCPSLAILGVDAPGCCTAYGKCGIDGSVVGMGCLELAAIASAGMMNGTRGNAVLGEIPPPKDCSPDLDAGVDMSL